MNNAEKDITTPSRSGDILLTAACCVALATLVPVALFQAGVVRELPDPPLPIFDSERVTRSKAAHPFGIPDGFLGLASFGVTLGLILLTRRHRSARTFLGLKLTLDASMAAFNAGRQVVQFGKVCSWCTVTALSSGVMAYSGRKVIRDAWPETGALLTRKLSTTLPTHVQTGTFEEA